MEMFTCFSTSKVTLIQVGVKFNYVLYSVQKCTIFHAVETNPVKIFKCEIKLKVITSLPHFSPFKSSGFASRYSSFEM